MFSHKISIAVLVIISYMFFSNAYAEQVLIYDEEKGIIFVDKDSDAAKKTIKKSKKDRQEPRTLSQEKRVQPKRISPKGITRAKDPTEIHVSRKKDPPEMYFKSGLEYYKNNDFDNAMKNFTYAADRDVKPEYLLWIGKTYRQLDKQVQMFTIMERILKDYTESDVADDALFEMAFYYQKTDDYNNATLTYKRLIEQYPFGLSYSSGEEFLDVAREQIRMMRGEMISALKVLGIKGEDLYEAYKQFQQQYRFTVTGKGNPETVRAIKQLYTKKIKEDEKIAGSVKRISQSIRWASIIGLVLCLNFIFIVTAWVKIGQNRKQLILLGEMLADLDKG